MVARAHAIAVSWPEPSGDNSNPWNYFHMTGSRDELAACLDRLRARGWVVSEQPPEPGPGGTWDVLVRPPSHSSAP